MVVTASMQQGFETPGKKCWAMGCRETVRPGRLMCYRHWRLVPGAISKRIYQHWRGVQGRKPDSLRLLRLAQTEAFYAVAVGEGKLRRVSPGCYFDPTTNELSIVVQMALIELGLPDTPDNRQAVITAGREIYRQGRQRVALSIVTSDEDGRSTVTPAEEPTV